jgi:hypothetical protein
MPGAKSIRELRETPDAQLISEHDEAARHISMTSWILASEREALGLRLGRGRWNYLGGFSRPAQSKACDC